MWWEGGGASGASTGNSPGLHQLSHHPGERTGRVGQDRTGQDRTERVELYACRLATLYAVGSGNLYHDLDLSRCMPSYPDQRSKIQTKPGKVKIQVRMKPARCRPAPASTHKMQIQPSSHPASQTEVQDQPTRQHAPCAAWSQPGRRDGS